MATRADDGLAGQPERAARLNGLLRTVGFTDAAVTLWWNQLAHAELDGRTAHQAWVSGEHERVTDLVRAAVTDGTAEREWSARLRAEAAAGALKGRLAAQRSPRAVVEQW